MSEVVFVDDPTAALSLTGTGSRSRRIVSLTAVASEALSRLAVPYEPVGHFADLRQLSAADDQFNRDVAALTASLETFARERVPSLNTEGPGFVTGHAYYIQYSVSAIAKRALLMRSALTALGPRAISVFDAPVDPWFRPDGYRQTPWIQIAKQLAATDGLTLTVLPMSSAGTRAHASSLSELVRHSHATSIRAARTLARQLLTYGSGASGRWRRSLPGRGRILFGDGFNDYFGAVIRLLVASGLDCFAVTPSVWEHTSWGYYYLPSVVSHNRRRTNFPIDRPRITEEDRTVSGVFDEWLSRRAPLRVLDFDVLPALAPQLRSIVIGGSALLRHANTFATRLLDEIRPSALVFSSITSLPQRRLAHLAIQREIPVAAYQHAFGYEAQRHASTEQTEPSVADYFLTFGPGVQPRADAVFPPTAKYISIGSARIESMRARLLGRPRAAGRSKRVLWVGEFSTRNTHVTTLQEDTCRHEVQKRCLEILSGMEGSHVVFRPYRWAESSDGTVQWLMRRGFPNVRVDTLRRLEDLAAESDFVVIDATSPTTWGETIALERPVMLYCDSIQARVEPVFAEALGRVVEWCRTPSEFIAAIERVAADPRTIRHADPHARAHFLQEYALGGNDHGCAERAVAFIASLIPIRAVDTRA